MFVSLMMKPVMMITGNNIIRAFRENAMSKMRFSDNCQSGIRSGYIWIRVREKIEVSVS